MVTDAAKKVGSRAKCPPGKKIRLALMILEWQEGVALQMSWGMEKR